jgi:hypothetical protein
VAKTIGIGVKRLRSSLIELLIQTELMAPFASKGIDQAFSSLLSCSERSLATFAETIC